MDRNQQYKHQAESADCLRDKRRHTHQELRKGKREQAVNGKRMRIENEEHEEYNITEQQVITLAQRLTNKTEDRLDILKQLRQAFSQGTALIDAYLSVDRSLSCLVGLLTGLNADVQLAAAWCVTNMSAGTDEHATLIIKHAAPYLVTYLSSLNTPLQDQCAWAIGNLAGGNMACRSLLITQGVLKPLIQLLQSPMPNVVQSATFALSNMARDRQTQQSLTDAGVLSSVLPHMVYSPDNLPVLTEMCWLLTYIASSGCHNDAILSAGLPATLVTLLIDVGENNSNNFQLLTPILRCLGNILCSCADDVIMALCSDTRLYRTIVKLLMSEHKHIHKESLWVLSNMTVVLDTCKLMLSADLFPPIIGLLSSTFDIKKEAAVCLCNVATHGEPFCSCLVELGALQGIVPLLTAPDPDTAHLALTFTEMILHVIPNGVQKFEECRGLDGLEALEYCNNEQLRLHTNQLLDTYFYKDD